MLVYPSGIDLSSSTLRLLARHLGRRRREIGSRWRRLSVGRRARLTLGHLRCGGTYGRLAAAFNIGIATVYRYIREAVDVLAALAPTLEEAVSTAAQKAYVVLNGTLLPIDRIAADRAFYSGKHKRHGMNIQVITDPFGHLLWASPALPGAVPRHQGRPHPRHPRRLDPGGHPLLGRQGLPRSRRHLPRPLPRPSRDVSGLSEAVDSPTGTVTVAVGVSRWNNSHHQHTGAGPSAQPYYR